MSNSVLHAHAFPLTDHSLCLSLFQYAESDEEHDGYVDTDEEVSNGKVNILNGNGPPYFHSYLYMKGKKSNDSIFLYKIKSLMQCLN